MADQQRRDGEAEALRLLESTGYAETSLALEQQQQQQQQQPNGKQAASAAAQGPALPTSHLLQQRDVLVRAADNSRLTEGAGGDEAPNAPPNAAVASDAKAATFGHQESYGHSLHHASPTGMISAFDPRDREHRRFADAYKRFRTWVGGCMLDVVKREVNALLYPVFVHLYLELMMRRHEQDKREARTFFKNNEKEHKQDHRAEMAVLEKLNGVDAVNKNPTAQLFLAHRYVVHLSPISHELLMRQLQNSDLLFPILHVLNTHIHLRIVAPAKRNAASEDESTPVNGLQVVEVERAGGTGRASVPVHEVNLRPLKLLWGSIEDRVIDEAMSSKVAADAAAEVGFDAAGREKRRRQEIEAAAPAAADGAAPGGSVDAADASGKEPDDIAREARAAGSVPLPRIDYSVMTRELEDARRRVRLSAECLPSVAMFTAQHCSSSLNCMAFTADGSSVACGFSDTTLHVFNTEEQFSTRRLRGHAGGVYGASFSPNSRLLASCGADANVFLWGCDAVLGNGPLVGLRGHSSACWDVAFAPLGHYIASASRDRTARVWASDRAQPLRIMAGHIADVDIVRWHPNCNYVATGSSDKTIRLWDVQTGETVRLLTGHNGSVTALAFSPDGYTLASGGDSGAVLLWDLRSGKRIATLKQHTDPVWSIAFEQGSGELLASSAADCSVRLWNCSSLASSTLVPPVAAAGASTPAGAADAPAVAAAGAAAAVEGGALDAKDVGSARERQENGAQSGAAPTAGAAAGAGAVDDGNVGKQPRALKVLYTKSTPCIALQFTRRNLLLAGGACSLLATQ